MCVFVREAFSLLFHVGMLCKDFLCLSICGNPHLVRITARISVQETGSIVRTNA